MVIRIVGTMNGKNQISQHIYAIWSGSLFFVYHFISIKVYTVKL